VPTTYELFETAEQIEGICAETYRVLAEQFGGDPETRELFERLASEELQHASRVKLLAARYRHDPRLLGAAVDSAGLDAMLAEALEALASVRSGSFARTPEEARAKAAEWEARFAHAHAELITRQGHPALREFFRQLAAQDRGHRELLRTREAGSETPHRRDEQRRHK
jgi:rubrerythrin